MPPPTCQADAAADGSGDPASSSKPYTLLDGRALTR
jgi:hypothetical protein